MTIPSFFETSDFIHFNPLTPKISLLILPLRWLYCSLYESEENLRLYQGNILWLISLPPHLDDKSRYRHSLWQLSDLRTFSFEYVLTQDLTRLQKLQILMASAAACTKKRWQSARTVNVFINCSFKCRISTACIIIEVLDNRICTLLAIFSNAAKASMTNPHCGLALKEYQKWKEKT